MNSTLLADFACVINPTYDNPTKYKVIAPQIASTYQLSLKNM